MGLDSAYFLAFLAVLAVLQAWLRPRGRVWTLLCASLAFYALSSPGFLVMLLVLCALNYRAVLCLNEQPDGRQRTFIFAITVLINLAVLVVFKYASNFVSELLARLGWIELNGVVAKIAAPLGLSYFTFQMLACVTDAYRRNWQPERGFIHFALFSFFFPQISSGPIPRAGRLLPQLETGGCPTAEDRLAGLRLIAYGLFKKLVVANRLVEYVNTIFGGAGGSTFAVMVACCFNALQLYADFSGYVDIAIGSARLLGVRLDPNFDRPFVSTSVTEFWRRWHMTLSFWLRDYLYMPLVIRIRNLGMTGIALAMIFTFAICGIWHGATWPFLFFGIAQGVAMSAEMLTKSWRTKRLKQFPKRAVAWTGSIYTLGFFVLSQVMFRSVDLTQAMGVYRRLFQLRVAGGLRELLGVGPFVFGLHCVAIAAWIITAYAISKTTDRATPWFLLLCAVMIMFLGCLGSGHFIYAKF
jgi:alginate O-acetyltransferase complex protein AlgI